MKKDIPSWGLIGCVYLAFVFAFAVLFAQAIVNNILVAVVIGCATTLFVAVLITASYDSNDW